ncbi:hypothetical protein Q8W71_28750, partial [Methylobacterium sp. NEAU 140]|uniref:hypothetical protein n=1 Tax=Methylobacterium sp. NEAU 140 TaxID=3064945 RepID=UPI0027327E6D
ARWDRCPLSRCRLSATSTAAVIPPCGVDGMKAVDVAGWLARVAKPKTHPAASRPDSDSTDRPKADADFILVLVCGT